jgi:hypothetical protein
MKDQIQLDSLDRKYCRQPQKGTPDALTFLAVYGNLEKLCSSKIAQL